MPNLPSTPHHHGEPLSLSDERFIKPTTNEAREKIKSVGVTIGWCQKAECRKRFIHVRHQYPGGWGPPQRLRGQEAIGQIVRRLKLAQESDWVWASAKDETCRKVKVMVR